MSGMKLHGHAANWRRRYFPKADLITACLMILAFKRGYESAKRAARKRKKP